jgi:integrase/recombinase XerD
MLFDWLVTGQIVPSNPAHAVRGPRHWVSKGATRVISSPEATVLLEGMDVSHVVGLRDRVLIAVMTYAFARVSAVVALAVEDYYPQKKHWWLKFHEKNGKVNEMPVTRSSPSISMRISTLPASRVRRKARCSAPHSVRRRCLHRARSRAPMRGAWCGDVQKMPGIPTAIGCHTFRATGLTDYLSNGGRIEVAQRMAGHSNAKTIGLYDRRSDDVSLAEVAKIGI